MGFKKSYFLKGDSGEVLVTLRLLIVVKLSSEVTLVTFQSCIEAEIEANQFLGTLIHNNT